MIVIPAELKIGQMILIYKLIFSVVNLLLK